MNTTLSKGILLGTLLTSLTVALMRPHLLKAPQVELPQPITITQTVQPDKPDFEDDAAQIVGSLNSSKLKHLLVYIHGLCEYYDVDYYLVKAVIQTESSWNHRAVSSSDAVGLMQVLPSTARDAFDTPTAHLYDPYVNVTLGIMYLAQLENRYGFADVQAVLTAYSHGPTVTKTMPQRYINSNDYVKKVTSVYKPS